MHRMNGGHEGVALILCSIGLFLPTQAHAQYPGVPIDPRMPDGLSLSSYLSHASDGPASATTLGISPMFRTDGLIFAAIGGLGIRDERHYPVVGGALSLNLLSFPRQRAAPDVALALQMGLTFELFDLSPETAVLTRDVPSRRTGALGVLASFRVPVAGTVVHPWVSGGLRTVSFDVGTLEGTVLPDLDGFGNARPAFGAGFSVGLGCRFAFDGMIERSWVEVPDPRVELGYGREYDSLTAMLGVRVHMSTRQSK